jgi:Helitron helicase-like domain at N-terminus
MTPNALKALALRYLNSGGKVLAVGHSDRIESLWNNTQLYPQMFPWLFPYGVGGIGTTHLSHKEHKRHLLMYHDKRFQTDVNFPFVAFSHEQMMANSTQSFLLVDQSRFGDISEHLMNIDWATLNDITTRLETGDHISPESDAEKQCFQLLRDLDAVSGKMHGSTTSKKFMRNEIWSLINHLGAPSWYITLSPADIQHPICIYFANTNEKFSPDIPSYDDRARMVCQNPVAGARFFHFMVQSFLEDVLGVNRSNKLGFYGTTSGYYGTVEQQGRLTLHLHMLLWILENLNPEDVRENFLSNDSIWHQKLIDWLERCHVGEFITGTHAEVSERIGKLKDAEEYVDPTMTLPVPPPDPCNTHVNEELVADGSSCQKCIASLQWNQKYYDTVDDLLLRSNVHNCNRSTKKDGTRKKNKTYAGCMDNIWGKCKACFPRATSVKSVIDETGAIIIKKLEPWINTFTPLVTYILRCNTDVTSLSSGTAIKSVTMYVSDYITKTTLKTHVIFDTIRSVFQKNNGMMSGSLPTKEKARRFMTKVANLLSAKAEMGAPMIAMYLLGNPDHYTGHTCR